MHRGVNPGGQAGVLECEYPHSHSVHDISTLALLLKNRQLSGMLDLS